MVQNMNTPAAGDSGTGRELSLGLADTSLLQQSPAHCTSACCGWVSLGNAVRRNLLMQEVQS